MIRALVKGGGLFTMGCLPGGVRTYRFLTRDVMGTQASHIVKMSRIWPGELKIMVDLAGGTLEGKRIWIHESGWTPFMPLLNYLSTGNGGAHTNTKIHGERILHQYITPSVNGALKLADELSKACPIPEDRIAKIDGLRWKKTWNEILEPIDTFYRGDLSPEKLPLDSNSMDVAWSGGMLEHYRLPDFRAFLKEAFRIMKPGASIVVILDHRDHMYHFDKKIPFLYHYGLSDSIYNATHFSPLLYHNRLLSAEVCEFFKVTGFEKVGIYRRPLPKERWVPDGEAFDDGMMGIERSKLAPRFKNASDDDLKSAAVQYIFRKPG